MDLAIRSDVRPHDHAVFVYEDESEMLLPLGEFLRGGMSAREMTAFVHAYPAPDAAHRFLASKIGDLPERERSKDLVLAHHRDAFERNGRIDHDHAGGVVKMLTTDARQHEKTGVRVFVDASKQYLSAGRTDEWFAFESWLGPRLAADFGLVCAYRASDLGNADVLTKVLSTHAYRFNAAAARRP